MSPTTRVLLSAMLFLVVSVSSGCASSNVYVRGSGWSGCVTTMHPPWGEVSGDAARFAAISNFVGRFGVADEALIDVQVSAQSSHSTKEGFGCTTSPLHSDVLGKTHFTFFAEGAAAMKEYKEERFSISAGAGRQVLVTGEGELARHEPPSMSASSTVDYLLLLRKFDADPLEPDADSLVLFALRINPLSQGNWYILSGEAESTVAGDIIFDED